MVASTAFRASRAHTPKRASTECALSVCVSCTPSRRLRVLASSTSRTTLMKRGASTVSRCQSYWCGRSPRRIGWCSCQAGSGHSTRASGRAPHHHTTASLLGVEVAEEVRPQSEADALPCRRQAAHLHVGRLIVALVEELRQGHGVRCPDKRRAAAHQQVA